MSKNNNSIQCCQDNAQVKVQGDQEPAQIKIQHVQPAADIIETEKDFNIRMDMPGLAPDDISVKLDKEILTVEAKSEVEGLAPRIFYRQFRDSLIVSLVMRGMLAGVAAVVCDVVINMLRSICSQKRIFPILMFVLAFAAVRFFGVNIILIILVCGLFGALDRKMQDKEAKA